MPLFKGNMQKLKLKKEYKKYSEYKNSGIDWLGEIPKGWDYQRLKFIANMRMGNAFNSEDYVDDGIFLIRISEVKDIIDFEKTKRLPENYWDKYKNFQVKKGNILLSMTGYVGETAIYNSSNKALLNQRVGILESNRVDDKFLYYLSKQDSFKKFLSLNSKSSAQENVSDKNILEFSVAFPPKGEQQKIAEFLDEKTELIDRIVEKKKRLVELLKEKRTAVINQAVTKGLDPNVEMVDSGVEWIGKIPKGWEMRKIARSFNIIGSGTTPSSTDEALYENGDVNWVITGDLNDGVLNETSKKITRNAFSNISTLKIYPVGSLLIAMYGATIGKLALLGVRACTNQACCAIADSKFFKNKFVYYWFLSNKKQIIENFSYGGGQPNISQNVIRELKIQSPNLNNQVDIVTYLDEISENISVILKKVEKSINLLIEFKSSLISNVVTGKVRP